MANTINEIIIIYSREFISDRSFVKNSSDAYRYFFKSWNKETIELFEEFKIILLNNASEILGIYTVSKGGVSSTVVEIKHIMFIALKTNSSSIILAHNHPSGNLKPSSADLKLTERINDACKIMDINLTDHIILGRESYCSFKDDGYL
ncbi:RadC family protein [Chryseobacterium sp. JAH]|uniref:JAB domain-containing protein n=1 Tax=Chryseobacterium sp. JAH TaxID=1742858 RepID=UPI000741415D|nr:JAB domain-containing protein [Chryseobacterium sp. JAH]KUJ51742.1 hypothetical protein AR685_08860 [Chryseobacterium sp. JAH]